MSQSTRRRVRQTVTQSLRRPSAGRLARSVWRGCKGGVVATVVMTVYRLPVFKALPPTAEFWSKYVGGGDPEQHFGPGLFLHLLYGMFAGGVYGLLASFVDVSDPVRRERVGLLSGLAFGLALSAVGAKVVFAWLLGRELRQEDALVFHVGHVVYGLSLGTFIALNESTGEVYDESTPTPE